MTISAQINPTGDYTQMFYRYDSSFSELNSSRVLNNTGSVSFHLPGGMDIQQLRLDPAESEGTFYLTGLQINIFGFPVEKLTPEEIYEYIVAVNRGETNLSAQGIQFNTFTSDPTCIFSDDFTTIVNNHLEIFSWIAVGISAILSIIFGFLVTRSYMFNLWNNFVAVLGRWCGHINLYSSAVLLAAAHFLFCFYIQHCYFAFESRLARRIVLYELFFFIVLQCLWQAIFRIIDNVRQKKQETLSFLKFAGIYFVIMLIFLILVWPGYYVTDEYVMLWRSTQWEIVSAYHYLVQGYLTLAQMLIPGAAGAELVQIFLISAVVGYIMQQIYFHFPKSRWIYLLYIPMVFPATLLNNLQWQKSIPGTYLEMLLLCQVICAIYDKRHLEKKDVIEWIVLTSITFTLRMDGFYYIFLAPILFCVLFHNQARRDLLIILVVGTLICGSTLQSLQYTGSTNTHYTQVNYRRLVYAPLTKADANEDSSEMEALNKLFDVETFRNAQNSNVPIAIVPYSQIDKTTLTNFKSASIRLIIKYPFSYVRQQLERFFLSSGFGAYIGKHIKYDNDTNYLNPNSEEWSIQVHESQHVEDVNGNPLNTPLWQKLRMRVIRFCMGRDIDNFNVFSIRDFLFNNLVPCMLILIGLWFYFLKKKQYALLGILTLFLLRAPILIGSASYVSFQYYLRFFVVGNAVPFFLLYRRLANKEIKNGSIQ